MVATRRRLQEVGERERRDAPGHIVGTTGIMGMKRPVIVFGIVLAACVVRGADAQLGEAAYEAAIRELAFRVQMREALALAPMLEADAVSTLIELTEIPSPPFGEAERGRRFASLLREIGLVDVTTDEVGNVIARRPGVTGAQSVALVAHLDTVFPSGTDVTVRRRGGRLYAPGIGDDTRGLVLLLNVARILGQTGVRTRDDVVFIGSVGEEGIGDLRGVRYLLRPRGVQVDQFIAIDGGGDSRVVNQALGSRRYIVTVTGPGGHSWGDFGLGNPAHALARAIYYFDEAASVVVNEGMLASYNVGRIGGGMSVNAVPQESWAEVDMRSVDARRLERLETVLRRSVERSLNEQNRSRDRGAALAADFELIGNRPSGTVDPSTPLVARALAVTRFLGFQPQLGMASTDANLPIARGIPAVTLGRGGQGGAAHSREEWWAPRDAHVGVQRALLLLVASAGLVD
ncbi:MAG: M20/M25/M40 family metallo-hydrolase [Acidobacteriota bacterium]|nr:M20/M25/M40 family metallo-hydrolase [Acidobacteriota bacterium]